MPLELSCFDAEYNRAAALRRKTETSMLQCSAQFRILLINAHFVADNASHALAFSATVRPTFNVEEEVVVIRNGRTPKKKIIYINNIDHAIISKIKLFADDCVQYGNIYHQNDHLILQNDQGTISSLANRWLIELNICKCVVLFVTLKRNSSFYDHNIFDTTLTRVTNNDYLDGNVSSDPNGLIRVKNILQGFRSPWFT